MSAISHAQKTVFLRYVYRNADPQTEEGRKELLAELSEAAVVASARGQILSAVSANGKATSYATGDAAGASTGSAAELVEWAYDFIGYDTIDEALEAVPPRCKGFLTSVHALRSGGGW